MQKVEGSNPFSRFPANRGFLARQGIPKGRRAFDRPKSAPAALERHGAGTEAVIRRQRTVVQLPAARRAARRSARGSRMVWGQVASCGVTGLVGTSFIP